jgi:hypothetical protein
MIERDFDAELGRRLREFAEAGVRPIDRRTIATTAIGTDASSGWAARLGRPTRFGLRLSPRLAAVGLLVLLVLTALIIAAIGRAPKPIVGGFGAEAIFVHAPASASNGVVDVIAVRSDGSERLVRRLDPSILLEGRIFEAHGELAQDGWLAVSTITSPAAAQASSDAAWALIDLRDPNRAPHLVSYVPVIGGAWGVGGRFVTTVPGFHGPGFHLQLVDATTGVATTFDPGPLPGGGPSLIVAADGSGLVVGGFDTLNVQHGRYGIAPFDGSLAANAVPPLLFATGERWIAGGGAALDMCAGSSSPSTSAEVRVTDVGCKVVDWYASELAPATFSSASFSADGRSLWLLLDRLEGDHHIALLARADSPRRPRIVASVDLGRGVVPSTILFGALAPDDSLIGIRYGTGPSDAPVDATTTVILPTSGGPASGHTGNLLGFVPADVSAGWPAGHGPPVGPVTSATALPP